MKSGFTLLETLIVVSITAFLSAMVLGYTQNSNQKLSLYVDRANVVGVIQKAKNLAMEKYKSTSADGSTICAFGVHFENNSSTYFIYNITQASGQCNTISKADCYRYNNCGGLNYLSEQKFALNQANIFTSSSDIYFVPPYFTTSSNATILIASKNISSNSVKIVVNGLDISAN
jgi:prepilin-type N-terminal cleavage/methylation domain-containing protein